MNSVVHQRQQLAEVQFVLRSAALFLEHLDLRLQRLLPELMALEQRWRTAQDRQLDSEAQLGELSQEVQFLQQDLNALESQHQQALAGQQQARQEASALGQEVQFLQRELGMLERILAGQESQQLQTALDLRQLFQHLEDELEQTLQRLEAYELRLQGFQGLQQTLRALEDEHTRLTHDHAQLQRSLTVFEESEQEYLQLLSARDAQLEQLKLLYEAELEQLAQTLEYSSQDQQQRQQQDQHLGKSLARLAQERNAIQRQQQAQLEQLEALTAENARLKAENEALQNQLQADQSLASGPLARRLQMVSYLSFYDTLQAFGIERTEALREAVAEGLDLQALRPLLEQRQQLQPGRLAGLLRAQGLQPVKASPPAAYVNVLPGPYPIGDDLQPAERPAHLWQSPGYQLAILPVTNADYQQFMAAGAYENPDYWLPQGWQRVQQQGWRAPAFWQQRGHHCGPDYPDYPVVGVSWYEAMAYASWQEATLPSEVEWEAAGRGPDGRRWPWGDSWQADAANTAEAELMHTTPVGLYPAGASALGCLDLVGNVFEWTRSLFRGYPYQVEDGREDPNASGPRTLRGCSWNHRGSYFTRLSYRFQAPPETRHSDIGFRCARPPAAEA